jgi:hypothetical protein
VAYVDIPAEKTPPATWPVQNPLFIHNSFLAGKGVRAVDGFGGKFAYPHSPFRHLTCSLLLTTTECSSFRRYPESTSQAVFLYQQEGPGEESSQIVRTEGLPIPTES